MEQYTTTVVLKLRGIPTARAALNVLKTDVDSENRPNVFNGLGIHFGRIVLLEEPGGTLYDSWCVLETNFDSAEADRESATALHLNELAEAQFKPLMSVFAACEGTAKLKSAKDLGAFLLGARTPSTAEYQGHTHRDLARISGEALVHRLALDFVSTLPSDTSSVAVHRLLRAHVHDKMPALVNLDGPPPSLPDPIVRKKKLSESVWPWISHVPLLIGSVMPIVASAVAEAFTPDFDIQKQAEGRGPYAQALLHACSRTEDRGAHNALTHLVPLKPGWIRARALAGLHRFLNGVARDHFDEVGMLGGIPSIHFAKWLLIDGGKRLLFLSNYDGNWESYLGDFVDGAAAGLNAAWTCTDGYPRTSVIFAGGANHEERFKAWARAHQRPTELFYTAYPRSAVTTINNATWMLYGLYKKTQSLSAAELDEWRRRLT